MNKNIWMPFDQVVYSGQKFSSELRSKLGVVCARVDRADNEYVIDFGTGAYIVSGDNLTRFQAKNRDDFDKAEDEIYRRRKPKSEDE